MWTVDTFYFVSILGVAMKVKQYKVRGEDRWCVDGKVNGKRKLVKKEQAEKFWNIFPEKTEKLAA